MPRVSSSSIARIEWGNGILSVWFVESGQQYDHPNVSKAVYDEFLASSSKGRFYNNYIRGRY